MTLAAAIAAIELAVIVLLVILSVYLRRRYEIIKLNFRAPIASRWARDFDDRFRETDIGPTLDAEVTLVGAGTGSFGSTSDTEAWVLGGLAKGCRQIFEFGTATGRTTYILARNGGPDARVSTLTLSSAQLEDYDGDSADSHAARQKALLESRHDSFLYAGTNVESRIEQLYGDSKQFDESPYESRCDLIFIDGSHALSYIKSDTEKALRMVRPGGVILWHDYRGKHVRPTRDVYRYLNELHRTMALTHIRGTSLVAYRA